MAKVTIEVRTDAETTVEVTAHSLVRTMEERPDDEAGRVLDEAVRRVRAALGLEVDAAGVGAAYDGG